MYFFHYDYFKSLNFYQLGYIFWGGLRFDISTVMISNSLLVSFLLFPINFTSFKVSNKISKGILLLNFMLFSIFLIFNFIDIPYFSYTHKRSSADIFFQIDGQTDIFKQLPQYIADYWYLILIFILLIYFTFIFYKKWFFSLINRNLEYHWNKNGFIAFLMNLIIISTASVIGIRGGLQRIPLDIVDANFYTEPQYAALVLNTPFSIIKSLEQKNLTSYSFYNNSENIQKLHLIKKYPFDNIIKKNIVVIILESFSKEYTGLGNKKSYTPFLDSLITISTAFDNAWSNGSKSIEGIPAILSSIPSWMENPFINSLYCNNNTNAFPELLKKENYFTAFFHGGINGTMNFDAYAKQAGFDVYYGKNEYNNNADFDGYWGIWDEPFLQFAANKINHFPQPFFISIFTLSSHHPFLIPEQYKNILPKGNLPIQQCIAYTDWALKKFFYTIQHSQWYKNTLFIITADHTGISKDPYYSSIAGRYQIPLIIFDPSQPHHQLQTHIIQQIDILPTTLYLIHYPHPFFSFGNNYFDTTIFHSAIYYENNNYFLANDSCLFSFNQFNIKQCLLYKNQQLLEINCKKNTQQFIEEYIKRTIQAYNNTLINNSIKNNYK